MATMIVRHKVASFESWKPVFDGMTDLRKKHGWLGHIVLRDASDPNTVTVINRVKTLDGAKAYGGSPELRQAMQKGGVVSPPEVTFLDDAEELRY